MVIQLNSVHYLKSGIQRNKIRTEEKTNYKRMENEYGDNRIKGKQSQESI